MEETKLTIKEETDLLKALGKVLSLEDECIKENEFNKYPLLMAFDVTNVMAIISKTERTFNVLRRFIREENVRNIPDLNDYESNGDFVSISVEYLTKAINILKCVDTDKILIKSKKDYPITLENEDFKIIIAPRVITE